ncbi:Hypothetical protein D9617_57g028990 [Elsinoe fawcettii]|nr:Hypothetical protein D9617_57g028990 [Elsinoe fawcettii]
MNQLYVDIGATVTQPLILRSGPKTERAMSGQWNLQDLSHFTHYRWIYSVVALVSMMMSRVVFGELLLQAFGLRPEW